MEYIVEVWFYTGNSWVVTERCATEAQARREAGWYLGGDARGIAVVHVPTGRRIVLRQGPNS